MELPAEEMKFKKSLGLADKLGARYALIIGEDEVASGTFTLKRLADAEQKKIAQEKAELLESQPRNRGTKDGETATDKDDYARYSGKFEADTILRQSLRAADADKEVVLMGWVHRRRDLGQLIFIDLRDRAGIAQMVFNKEQFPEAHAKAEELRSEFVVAVEGRVMQAAESESRKLPSGEVEVLATRLHILNNSKTPPFQIEDEVTASEETRLRYRYLDLRRPQSARNIELRHRVILEIRKALDEMGFFEIETPMLTRSTPEGARDYLVPSRVHHGQFYALPQSPQIFKQILMISGMDRYFQIVQMLPRRGSARRPPAGIHAARPGNVVPAPGGYFRGDRTGDGARLRGGRRAGEGPVPPPGLQRRAAALRLGQARPALRHGIAGCDGTSSSRRARRCTSKATCRRLSRRARLRGRASNSTSWPKQAKAAGARGVYTVKVDGGGHYFAARKKSRRGRR